MVPAKKFGVKVTQYFVGFGQDRLVGRSEARPSTASRRSRSVATSRSSGCCRPTKRPDEQGPSQTAAGMFAQLGSSPTPGPPSTSTSPPRTTTGSSTSSPGGRRSSSWPAGRSMNILLAFDHLRARLHADRRHERRPRRSRPSSRSASVPATQQTVAVHAQARNRRRPRSRASCPATRSSPSTARRSTAGTRCATVVRASTGKDLAIVVARETARRHPARDTDDATRSSSSTTRARPRTGGFLGVEPDPRHCSARASATCLTTLGS